MYMLFIINLLKWTRKEKKMLMKKKTKFHMSHLIYFVSTRIYATLSKLRRIVSFENIKKIKVRTKNESVL